MSSTRVEVTPTGFVADTVASSVVDGPGHRFVVFLQGCNFDCVACHNPQTIPGHAPVEGYAPRHRAVDELVEEIRAAAPFLRGVTVSGGEATQQHDVVRALFAAVKADSELRRLTCLVDSNGACDLAVWDELAPVMDGAMIDLKCLDPVVHELMTGQPNDAVLRSIEHLHDIGRLEEVRLLVVGGVNDDVDLVRRTGEWLAGIDPHLRLQLIGFREHGARPHDPPLVEPDRRRLDELAGVLAEVAPFDICVV